MRNGIENVKNGISDISSRWWASLGKAILNIMRIKPRIIEDVPTGFDEQDVRMANAVFEKKNQNVVEFLAPGSRNVERSYQIGIAFVGKHSGGGHAEIIIRDGDNLSEIKSPGRLDLTASLPSINQDDCEKVGPRKLLDTGNIRLRVLHLRNVGGGGNSLELALEARPRVQSYKYIDLYRIYATERRLKHLALISCPEKHILLADDCATFCHTFLQNMLDHLLECGKDHGGIDRDEYRHQKRFLKRQIHIKDGLIGELELTTISPEQSELANGDVSHSSQILEKWNSMYRD